jgi:hypothetical protein
MANLLNFAHWKVKSHNNGKAVMTHKDGHFMTISTKHLPKIQQEQIKKLAASTLKEQHLADGGKVEDKKDVGVLDTLKTIAHDATPWGSAGAAVDSMQGNYASAPQPPAPDPALPPAGSQPDPAATAPAEAPAPDIQQDQFQPAVNQEAKGLEQQRDVAKQLAPQEAKAHELRLDQDRELVGDTVKNTQELAKHAQDYSDYLRQNPIKNDYLDNRSTGQAVAQGIGLFLAGFGGQGHVAMDFLNKQIDRNLQVQRDNADNQKNVWGAYHQLYGDQVIANNMTRVALNDQLLQKMEMYKAQLGTQTADAQYNLAQGALQKQNAQLLGVSAQRATDLQTGKAAPEPHEGAAAREQREADSKLAPELHSILKPGHEQAFRSLQYNQQANKHAPELEKEYTRAKQADVILKQLPEVFKKLASETNGAMGYAGRKLNHLGAVAGGALGSILGHGTAGGAAGAATGEALMQGVTGLSPQNRSYDSDRSRIVGDIVSAIGGPGGVGVEGLDRAVEANLPESGDSPEVQHKKLTNIAMLIKNKANPPLLSTYGKGSVTR